MINSFTGIYRFLSNFYPSPIFYEGEHYDTVEHAYQAMKTLLPNEQLQIRNAKTPGQAKRLGKKVTLRLDWEDIKLNVMNDLLKLKFNIPELKQMLLNTDDVELIEGNYWHDNFFGSCTCNICNNTGKNHLGKLLMKIREEIR